MKGTVEGRPLDEEQGLIERARNGELDAFDELVRRYQDIAFRTAFVVTRSAAEAEDAAQSAFIKAHASMHRFREGAPFRPWLLKIVTNEALNARRSAGRRAGLELRLASDRRRDAAPSPEAAVLAGEPRRALLDALNKLDDKDRLVIALRYLFELSEAETAETLGIRRGTVKSRLSRALGRLRDLLPGEVTE